MTAVDETLEFKVSDEHAAHEPPEARGLTRDQVRLMVSRINDDVITHARFFELEKFLAAGDVLVVNISATINAALEAIREPRFENGRDVMLHLSAPLSEKQWVVELRHRSANGTSALLNAETGERVRLPAGGIAQLVAPYLSETGAFPNGPVRLWIADLTLPSDALAYTAQYGSPIRYAYAPKPWPLTYYQTVFSSESGSAEMPSAGRAFTSQIVQRLILKGVRIAPLILHTGVSSLEAHEPPYPERYHVPRVTALAVNTAHSRGTRVVAVGTTVARALETVADEDGHVRSGHGWTDLVITPERGLRVVDAMLTGLHEPKASHLSMLEALACRDHLALAYHAALDKGYLWHEFGDLHLIIPGLTGS